MSNLLQELLAAPAKRLSVQFREDLERAVQTEADGQFQIISLAFDENRTAGAEWDWGCRRTIRWDSEGKTTIHWTKTDGKRFCYDVGRFFLHEKEEGDEAE